MEIIIQLAILSALLTIFLNYCIGKPASEFSPYEIFSGYTIWLSIKRLQAVGLYKMLLDDYNNNLKNATIPAQEIELKNDFKKRLYNEAEPYFTWERATGMCPICTGFWITLFTAILFTQNLFEIIYIIVISHLLTRIIIKFL